jgi:hypothetical protein
VRAGLSIAVLAVLAGGARGQVVPAPPPMPAPEAVALPGVAPDDEAVENYLAERGLLEVLAARLRRQHREGTAEEQVRAAELLGKLYVRMLTEATTPEKRQEIEGLCRELLKDQRADSFELRLNLAKATYLRVEEIVERDRLRMAGSEERAEAERVLRTVKPTFEEISRKLDARVRSLEAREKAAPAADVDLLRAELAEQRRLRSLSLYYAGWSHYYTAVLTGSKADALDAMRRFGGLLNAVSAERPATIDRLPKANLRYEHVARAALACALCAALLEKPTEAARWLDEVEQGEEVVPIVREQIFSRRLIVHAAASQWADIDLAVRKRRKPERDGPEILLSVPDARLLAVTALEAARATQSAAIRAEAERQAQVALGDLIKRGEAGHVLDLVSLYGTTPIGQEGFIVNYVVSLQSYERARAAHKTAGNEEEPAVEPAVVNLYREAAGLLAAATGSADAPEFPKERERAEIRRGLALFYAGDLEAAATQFQAAANVAVTPEQKRDALWYAIVSLDRAVERGNRGVAPDRDRVATLYLEQFPASENAARLLLRQTRADRLSDEEALEILLKVARDSGIYEASRKQAARLLYQAYRRSQGEARDFAALRFAEVAEGVLRLEQARAMAGTDQVAKDAAADVVVRVRQLADALLGATAPDTERVEGALAVLDTVAAFHSMDLESLKGELLFRRVQIAMARGDEAGIARHVDLLRGAGGPFADATDRLLYQRSQRAFKAADSDVALARQVVRYGARILESEHAALDPGVASMRDSVAQAAAVIWRAEGDVRMRDLAVRVDREQLEAGQRTASSLRRLGELLEAGGDKERALAAWRELLNGVQNGTPEWYEARYESLRLLLETSPGEAAAAMGQHRVLHPDFGPEPWGSKLRELDAKIGAAVPPPPTPAPAAAPGKGGAG